MGTKKIALKRSHTEKAKLTRARPRFSFGFSRLAITFSRVTSQSHNLVIDLASFHQVEGGTETSLKLSTVGNFDTTRNQEKKRKRGKEEKRKRGKEEKRKRGKEENGLLTSRVSFLARLLAGWNWWFLTVSWSCWLRWWLLLLLLLSFQLFQPVQDDWRATAWTPSSIPPRWCRPLWYWPGPGWPSWESSPSSYWISPDQSGCASYANTINQFR